METSLKIAWALLALLHVVPAMVVIAPGLVEKLYGMSSDDDVAVLLVHRGVLFIAVCATALYAIFNPDSRRLASIVLAISMVGYLIVYARAGMPEGELQKIAIADVIWLIPLTWASYNTWQ